MSIDSIKPVPQASEPRTVKVALAIKADITVLELVELLIGFGFPLGEPPLPTGPIDACLDDRDVFDAIGRPLSRHIKRVGSDSPWQGD